MNKKIIILFLFILIGCDKYQYINEEQRFNKRSGEVEYLIDNEWKNVKELDIIEKRKELKTKIEEENRLSKLKERLYDIDYLKLPLIRIKNIQLPLISHSISKITDYYSNSIQFNIMSMYPDSIRKIDFKITFKDAPYNKIYTKSFNGIPTKTETKIDIDPDLIEFVVTKIEIVSAVALKSKSENKPEFPAPLGQISQMFKATKKTLIEFPANKRNGLFVSYYEDGQKLEEANYINGIRNGSSVKWYNNGHLAFTRNYLNGKLSGVEKFYLSNGVLKFKRFYFNDELLEKFFYNNDGSLNSHIDCTKADCD